MPVISNRLSGAVIAIMVAGAGGVAPAQAPSEASFAAGAAGDAATDVGELIRSLDSEHWAQRQQAQDVLRETITDLVSLEEALGEIDHELSPEARRRLIKLGEEAFLRSPRPGVGISFSRDSAGDGVRIESTVAGFDADEHLKRGDIIVSFGGLPTPNEEEMRTAIMVHDPEDVVELSVRRGNEIVPIQLRLGWFRDLNPASARQPDKAAMRRAWAIRCAQHLESSAPEDLAGQMDLTQALWQGADVVTGQAQLELQQRRRPRAVYVPEVVVQGAAVADDNRADVVHRVDAFDADLRRQQLLRTIDQRVALVNEQISALEEAHRRLGGDHPAEVDLLKQQLDQLRAQRDELLALRDRGRP